MTEALYQFDFSEDKTKKKNRDMLFVIIPVVIVCIGGFALYITGFAVREALPISCYTLLIILVIMAIEMPLMQGRMRKIKAFIYNDKIVKKCGKQENRILWDNITRVKIIENNKGETVHIQLRGRDKAILWLGGLNEMGKLASLIRERISGDILVNTKRSRLDERIVIAISAIGTMIVMAIIASLGAKAMDIFAILAALVTSCLLLLFRPFSKACISFKWPGIILSLLMFLLGIYGLVSLLRSGNLP